MKKIFVLVFVSLFLYSSCSNNSFEEILFRTIDDPFFDVPEVDSGLVENTIFIQWQEDEACDCFYLMKSHDQKELKFSCVYKGDNNSFIDSNCESDNCYIYRLDKKRGNKYFMGENYSYGYSASCRKDSCEPNNTEKEATHLEYDVNCNLSCIQLITDGFLFNDVDWFYVSLPPKRSAEIIVSQKGLANANVGSDTNLKIQKAGSVEEAITEKTPIYITNTSDKTSNLYFKIFLNNTALFEGNANNAVIEYTVSLNKIFYRQ